MINDAERNENEARIKALLTGVNLPATTDYRTIERLIQRELDALVVGDYLWGCECAEIAIRILDEIGCRTVFVGNANPICALAHRYAHILCEKYWWAAESNCLDFHEALTSIISGCLKKVAPAAKRFAMPPLAGALLEDTELLSGHWRGFRKKLALTLSKESLTELIIQARAKLIAEWNRLEKENFPLVDGERGFKKLYRQGPHFE
jgi:hypothetical protein